MVLTTSFAVETLPKTMMLAEDISSSASSFKISYVPLAMTKGVFVLDEGQDNEERVTFNSVTDNGDGTATCGDAARGIAYSGSSYTASASRAYNHTGGSCTVRLVVAHELLNLKADTDRANTFSALQTFTAGIYASGSGSYVRLPNMTTAQRTSLSAANGMMVYDTDLGQIYKYESGAWSAVATGTFSVAANATAGKIDVATLAEIAAGTATDATSGALNALVVGNTRLVSAGAGDSGGVPVLGTDGLLDITLGGTKKGSFTAYAPIFGGTTSTGALQSGTVGTAKQVLMSNGAGALPTFQTPYPGLIGTITTATSSIGASSTAENAVAPTFTGTNSVTAGLLTIGSRVIVNFSGSAAIIAGTLKLRVKLGGGSTNVFLLRSTNGAAYAFDATCYFTLNSAPGAAATIGQHGTITANQDATVINTGALCASGGSAVPATFTADTTGALAVTFTAEFSSSNASNGVTINFGSISVQVLPA